MFIEVLNEEDFEIIINKLSKIFGIHSIVIANKTDNNIDNIKKEVLKITKEKNFNTFKIETKRSNKNFSISESNTGKKSFFGNSLSESTIKKQNFEKNNNLSKENTVILDHYEYLIINSITFEDIFKDKSHNFIHSILF